MPSKRKAEPAKEVLPDVEPLLAQPFRAHCNQHHRLTMRMITKGEHAADHRLHADLLDHIHKAPEPPSGMDPNTGRAPADDWNKD
jgi:hypothetical protein